MIAASLTFVLIPLSSTLAQDPAPPRPAETPDPQRSVAPAAPSELERRIDEVLQELRRDIETRATPGAPGVAGDEPRDEPPSFDELRALLRQSAPPAATAAGTPGRSGPSRLERAVDALERREFEGELGVVHVDMLHEQVIDSRIDAKLDALGRRVAAGETVDPAELATLRAQVDRRVEVASSFDPTASELVVTLRSPLDLLRDRAAAGELSAADLGGFRSVLNEARIDHAISALDGRARAGDLGLADIQRLRDVVEDQIERAPDPEVARAEYAGLTRAIDGLDQGIRDGTLQKGQTAALRRELKRHAREASSERPRDR